MDSMVQSPVDHEVRRLRNIERNNDFLRALQIGDMTDLVKPRDDVEESNVERKDIIRGINATREEFSLRCEQALSDCKDAFPFRELEADRLVSYIQQVWHHFIFLNSINISIMYGYAYLCALFVKLCRLMSVYPRC